MLGHVHQRIVPIALIINIEQIGMLRADEQHQRRGDGNAVTVIMFFVVHLNIMRVEHVDQEDIPVLGLVHLVSQHDGAQRLVLCFRVVIKIEIRHVVFF